jgi:hypothetical protein
MAVVLAGVEAMHDDLLDGAQRGNHVSVRLGVVDPIRNDEPFPAQPHIEPQCVNVACRGDGSLDRSNVFAEGRREGSAKPDPITRRRLGHETRARGGVQRGVRVGSSCIGNDITQSPPAGGGVSVQELAKFVELVIIETRFPQRPDVLSDAWREPRHDLVPNRPVVEQVLVEGDVDGIR